MSFKRRGLICALALSVLTLAVAPTARAQNSAVTLRVDASANRVPINPFIYGLDGASSSALADLNCPINRRGGNASTRYNWQQNADNRGRDWYFQSIGYGSSTPGAEVDAFISYTKAQGAEPMPTIPIIGWVAKLGSNRNKLASFSIAKYGPQTDRDWQWFPDAGNGISSITGQFITGNDPNDANVLSTALFQQDWIAHLAGRWGLASQGGVRYYTLDNEPSIWHSTHRDVHPLGATMEEVRDRILDYAARIKETDPGAQIVAPEEWGWSGYLFSGYDQQYGSLHGWSYLPDRSNHGGWDYLPWLLDQLRRNHEQTGKRLLDIFSVHYYPQGGEFSNDTSTAMQQRRNRSTRSLWDPNYRDETWINDKVQLIPRLKNWVNAHYPGTKIALTEYNWGAENHINGAIAQADLLGIFGREGLDMATRWGVPTPSTPTYKAIKMYRNYDGSNSGFGDTSVLASAPDPDNVAVFAATRSGDGALTVMALNKALTGSTPVTVNLENFSAGGAAQTWQLTSANVISRIADAAVSNGSIQTTLPPQSITLFVIPVQAVEKADTRILVRNDQNQQFTGNPGQGVWLKGNVARLSDGAGLEGRTLIFKIDGQEVGTATTIASGSAWFRYVIPVGLGAGAHTVTVEFAGDAQYHSSSGQGTLTVGKADTRIRVISDSGGQFSGRAGQGVWLKGNVARVLDGAGLAGRTLTFKVDGQSVGTATTIASGSAWRYYAIPAGASPGAHTVTVEFAGDGQNNGSSGQGTLTVTP